MTGNEFLKKINDIDDDLLAAAAKEPARKTINWSSYAAIAASIFFLFGAGLFVMQSLSLRSSKNSEATLVAFQFEDCTYVTPDLNSYVEYNLITASETTKNVNLTISNLTAEDLGAKMGIVKVSINNKTYECPLYHYKKYADSSDICIIEYPKKTYNLYVKTEE